MFFLVWCPFKWSQRIQNWVRIFLQSKSISVAAGAKFPIYLWSKGHCARWWQKQSRIVPEVGVWKYMLLLAKSKKYVLIVSELFCQPHKLLVVNHGTKGGWWLFSFTSKTGVNIWYLWITWKHTQRKKVLLSFEMSLIEEMIWLFKVSFEVGYCGQLSISLVPSGATLVMQKVGTKL